MPKPPRLAPQSSAPGFEVGIQGERRANVVQSGEAGMVAFCALLILWFGTCF